MESTIIESTDEKGEPLILDLAQFGGKTKLNLGCGESKYHDYINIDMVKETQPDLVYEIGRRKFPFEDESMDEVVSFHFLEHLEYPKWKDFFFAIYDVLKPGGRLVLGYPEFEICARYYMENHLGQRDFWRRALYGRQCYPGDYHVSPVVTRLLVQQLKMYGFKDFKNIPEGPGQEYATVLRCIKGLRRFKEESYRDTLFTKTNGV